MKRVLLALALAGAVQGLDRSVQDAVQGARQPWLDPVMRVTSDVGRPAVIYGALLVIAMLDPAGPALARAALVVLLPVNLGVEALKRATDRARPDGEHKRSNAAFPSSHAANAFALASVLAARWRRGAWAFWLFATLVAISRVYLNRHWMTDVVAGALLGSGIAWWARLRVAPGVERWYQARLRAGG